MITIARILHPTDLSVNAQPALHFASDLCRLYHAELHLLSVVDSRAFAATTSEPDFYPVDFLQEYVDDLEKRLTEVTFEGMQHCKKIVREISSGIPYNEILGYSDKHAVDLIVMGTHGRTGLGHLLIGSVAENVVRRAQCPVLTVRPDNRKSSG